MKLNVTETTLQIIPESKMEVGWIEAVLGLKNAGDSIPLTREDVVGLSSLYCLEAKGD